MPELLELLVQLDIAQVYPGLLFCLMATADLFLAGCLGLLGLAVGSFSLGLLLLFHAFSVLLVFPPLPVLLLSLAHSRRLRLCLFPRFFLCLPLRLLPGSLLLLAT